MDFMLVFTFTTLAGLVDMEELLIEGIDSKQMCEALAGQAISTWAQLAEVQMAEVTSIDCMPVGEEA